jgi:aryl-alcohol dehydrogenase-like predicted oxidoreductase
LPVLPKEREPMILTRREMLKLSAGAGAALALGRLPAFAEASEIIKRPIPSSGELIPAVGLGTARTFNVGTSEEERAPLREVLEAFVAMGGTVLDTAPGYRNSERVAGELARELGVTDKLFMATKVGAEDRERGIEQMQNSMRLLDRDVIDLMQVHNLRGWRTQLATLREWKAAGRIRYIGITTSSLRQYELFAEIMEKEELDFVQLNYSIATREAEKRLLPLARDRGMAVLVNRPYNLARLFRAVEGHELPDWAAEFDAASWGQFFLKFILSHPAVTCPIPATSKVAHLRDNMGAAYGRLPDERTRRRMVELFESL